jgi:hypothetical protein
VEEAALQVNWSLLPLLKNEKQCFSTITYQQKNAIGELSKKMHV